MRVYHGRTHYTVKSRGLSDVGGRVHFCFLYTAQCDQNDRNMYPSLVFGVPHRRRRRATANDRVTRSRTLLFLACTSAVLARGRSSTACSQYSRPPTPGYHLTKECAASNMRTVASSNATELDSCAQLAAAKGGFAFTYAEVADGPDDLKNAIGSTCNVYECPEFHQFLLTNSVSVYNYYSMFSKPLPSENYTCAPGIGVFEMVMEPMNYSNAMVSCEEAGGHLANIGSDSRTSFLAGLVQSWPMVNRTKTKVRKAFVGLFFENDFVTITGVPLSCLPFRAWAPGHPKARRLKKDCVVITSNRYWETEDCSKKIPYICELIPDGPLSPVERYCAPISNTKRRKNCIIRNHKKFEQNTEQTKQQCIDGINMNKTEVINDNN